MKYFNVVINNNSRHTDSFYTYKGEDNIKAGDVVTVTFGGKKEKTAYVIEETSEPDLDPSKVKEIISVDPVISLSDEMISTCLWMKSRYGIKYIDAIKCFIPKGKPAKEGKQKRPLENREGEAQEIESLTSEQAKAVSIINRSLLMNKQETFLIHGVTGSGKTEVYMQAIKKALDLGKTSILLVPEIALTKQITERLIARFGKENLAILHSRLTGRERFDEWERIRSGQAKIVVGARMAVFAPVENLGLIIMDEEHESTYKADMTPKYDTVDIATKRLMHYKGVLLLGSATPSITSYYRVNQGLYKLIELKERYNGAKLPKVEIVDMRDELKEGNTSIFSGLLYSKISETIEKGQQVILFLNRRGYSTFISCRQCGFVLSCDLCGISLTYHKSENAGICHYCGRKFPIPTTCPECGSKYIKHFGAGTEKVEEITKEMFPDYSVERLDIDTAKNKKEINRILNSFAKGKTDILIGTQLVAKGLDFKNVGLVGVIASDSSLNIPDYRSSERTFQLITQVAGRAGRGDEEGLVIVQTYEPESDAIKLAAEYNFDEFYRREILLRQLMDYPPFTDLIMVEFLSNSKEEAESIATDCINFIKRCKITDDDRNIFDPKLSTVFKGNKESFRFYILIKSPKELRNKYVFYIDNFRDRVVKAKKDCTIIIDVNPYSVI